MCSREKPFNGNNGQQGKQQAIINKDEINKTQQSLAQVRQDNNGPISTQGGGETQNKWSPSFINDEEMCLIPNSAGLKIQLHSELS